MFNPVKLPPSPFPTYGQKFDGPYGGYPTYPTYPRYPQYGDKYKSWDEKHAAPFSGLFPEYPNYPNPLIPIPVVPWDIQEGVDKHHFWTSPITGAFQSAKNLVCDIANGAVHFADAFCANLPKPTLG